MVFNHTRVATLPFSSGQMSAHTRIMRGKGMGCGLGAGMGCGLGAGIGSVLLRLGGGGNASSYRDMDDYVATTGINPYSRGKSRSVGEGMKKMREKLSKLSVEEERPVGKPKMKKIQMSF